MKKPERRGITTTVFGNPWVRFLGILLVLYLVLEILYAIRGVLIPFCLALIAAYVFDPVVDWIEATQGGSFLLRRAEKGPSRVSRGLAVGVLVGFGLVLVAAFVFLAVPNMLHTTTQLLGNEKIEQVLQALPEAWQGAIMAFRDASPEERRRMVSEFLTDVLAGKGATHPVGEGIRAVALSTFSLVLGVFQFLLFFVVAIYLLLDIDWIAEKVKEALPLRHKSEILRIAERLDANLKAFFRGQCVVVAALGCIYTAGLALVGCPFWYIIGIAGGIGAFVPYFDLAVGMVPAVIVSGAFYQDVWHPVAAAAVFAVGKAVDNVLITPKILGVRVGMHPVMIILSILVFGTLFGFLGILFAIPIAAVVKVLCQELFARYKASPLYTGQTEDGITEQ